MAVPVLAEGVATSPIWHAQTRICRARFAALHRFAQLHTSVPHRLHLPGPCCAMHTSACCPVLSRVRSVSMRPRRSVVACNRGVRLLCLVVACMWRWLGPQMRRPILGAVRPVAWMPCGMLVVHPLAAIVLVLHALWRMWVHVCSLHRRAHMCVHGRLRLRWCGKAWRRLQRRVACCVRWPALCHRRRCRGLRWLRSSARHLLLVLCTGHSDSKHDQAPKLNDDERRGSGVCVKQYTLQVGSHPSREQVAGHNGQVRFTAQASRQPECIMQMRRMRTEKRPQHT